MVALLLGVELLDELYSGVPAVGAADIQAGLQLSYSATAWALLLVPGGIALLIEPILFVLADRHPRKWFICGGLWAMGLAALLAAVATEVVVLSAAITLAWIGSGSAVTLSQATLVDAHPTEREQVLTRWALLGEIGDLLAPVAMAAMAALGAGWRGAFVVVGAVSLLWGASLIPHPIGAASDDEREPGRDDEPRLRDALAEALSQRRLLFWLGATALCDLLDEIVIVFGALYLHDQLGLGAMARSAIIAAGVAGAIVGVAATSRLLKTRSPRQLLIVASLGCAIAYLTWLNVRDPWLSGALFFVVGACAAPMYPIASAQAYAALPGRSGMVNAVGQIFAPLTLAAPWLIGMVADRFGLTVALALLLVQPLGLASAAWSLRR